MNLTYPGEPGLRTVTVTWPEECLEFGKASLNWSCHEIPHLVDSGSVPYPADDAALPLKAGMVLSVETTMAHPRRGYIKLEDTVAVLADGYEFFGGAGRCLNRGKA